MSKENPIHTRLLELEEKSLTEIKIELKKANNDLEHIEQWIITQWYMMIEDYLHGADNWKDEIEEHENARLIVNYCKDLMQQKRAKRKGIKQ